MSIERIEELTKNIEAKLDEYKKIPSGNEDERKLKAEEIRLAAYDIYSAACNL